MQDNRDFTTGRILTPLIRFMAPIFFAMLLQAMYGAVDLVIVGQFASSSDVSAVSTGSQMMMTITNLVTSFAMGTTILLGQRIGEGRGREGGAVIGGSISLFALIAAVFTLVIPLMRNQLSAEEKMMRADYVVLNYEGNPRSRQVQHIHHQIIATKH